MLAIQFSSVYEHFYRYISFTVIRLVFMFHEELAIPRISFLCSVEILETHRGAKSKGSHLGLLYLHMGRQLKHATPLVGLDDIRGIERQFFVRIDGDNHCANVGLSGKKKRESVG